jgi:HEAT repeat protein
MRPARSAAASLVALALLCGPACKPSDPKDPQTWIGRLGSGESSARTKAIAELRKLKARTAAPAIAKLLADGSVREDAVVALGELGGAESVQPLLDAIDTNVGAGSDTATRAANRTNAKIADALGQLGDAKAGPALLRLSRARDDLVRVSAVQALGQLRFGGAVPELVHIVDEEATPPLLIKKAVIALGQIGDPAGIPALEHALVIEKQGVSFVAEASYALFSLGPAAVEPVLQLATDQDKAYLAWAKERNRAPAGTYAKAALVLGDLGDARAVPVLLGRLKYTDPEPNPPSARLLTNLVREFSADALGRLRAKEAVKPVLELLRTQDAQDERLVGFASNALVWIGERTAAPELIKRASSPAPFRLRFLCAQAAALLGEAPLKASLLAAAANGKDKKPSRDECAMELTALQIGGDPAEGDACERLQQERGKAFALLGAPLDAAQACGSGAAATACWKGKLADRVALVRARAAYELGRAGAIEAVAELAKAATDDDVTARLAAIRALEWMVPLQAARDSLKAAAPALQAQLAQETGKVQFVKVNEELRRLQARMSRL